MLGKVFVIGFNKCGTSSFAYLFRKSGMKVADNFYKHNGQKRNLARKIDNNLSAGNPSLHGIDQYDAYSDIELSRFNAQIQGIYNFRKFDEDYPDSKFILNIRDKDKWLNSRSKHGGGRYLEKYKQCENLSSDDEVIDAWSNAWDTHIANVQSHFKDRDRALLVYNIETDDPNAIAAFLPERNIDTAHWQKKNAKFGWNESEANA